jgi:hypothetical protein
MKGGEVSLGRQLIVEVVEEVVLAAIHPVVGEERRWVG